MFQAFQPLLLQQTSGWFFGECWASQCLSLLSQENPRTISEVSYTLLSPNHSSFTFKLPLAPAVGNTTPSICWFYNTSWTHVSLCSARYFAGHKEWGTAVPLQCTKINIQMTSREGTARWVQDRWKSGIKIYQSEITSGSGDWTRLDGCDDMCPGPWRMGETAAPRAGEGAFQERGQCEQRYEKSEAGSRGRMQPRVGGSI